MKKWLVFNFLFIANCVDAIEVDPYANTILRYENEVDHNFFADRERLRLIARAGLDLNFDSNWSAKVGLRTGLKDRQNVPALTIARFTEQRQPANDIFVDRLFLTGKFNKLLVTAGKIPWQTKQVTDIFWDRDLNPLGVHLNYQLSNNSKLSIAHFAPLDGSRKTVGQMTVFQWQNVYQLGDWAWSIAPWIVNYNGQAGAEFAQRDTQLDNRSLRFSTNIKKGLWQLGLDVGHSLSNFDNFRDTGFQDQKSSAVFEVKHGTLKNVGSYQWHIRYLHVERFAVITEFAQNATSPVHTSNMKGIDIRLRRKMGKNWWLGTRFSDLERLVGEPESGIRFRIEARYNF